MTGSFKPGQGSWAAATNSGCQAVGLEVRVRVRVPALPENGYQAGAGPSIVPPRPTPMIMIMPVLGVAVTVFLASHGVSSGGGSDAPRCALRPRRHVCGGMRLGTVTSSETFWPVRPGPGLGLLARSSRLISKHSFNHS